ncbi:MAG TPA: rhodanese-like domain-containing protein [Gemmatimonadota bacterium]|nr:rhodanese-like domain-containing protein [Gemmatimonadota bacterium]
MPKTILREELKQKIDRGDHFRLVETLGEEKYRQAHLPDAINLPPDRIQDLAPEILPDKDETIVVYCASPTCNASANAARALADMGYTDIRDYEGGKSDWVDHGLPVERVDDRPEATASSS